jgi:hypothetical protein
LKISRIISLIGEKNFSFTRKQRKKTYFEFRNQ